MFLTNRFVDKDMNTKLKFMGFLGFFLENFNFLFKLKINIMNFFSFSYEVTIKDEFFVEN